MSEETDHGHQFEDIDWSAAGKTRSVDFRALLFGLVVIADIGLFLYRYTTNDPNSVERKLPILGAFEVNAIDWLYYPALVLFVLYVLYPLARNPDALWRYWQEYRSNRLAVVAGAYLVVFAFVGLFGPIVVPYPGINLRYVFQPPVWGTVPIEIANGNCAGPVIDGMCHGTWRFPLGTTVGGKSVLLMVAYGAIVAFKVALVVGTLSIPIGLAVGTVAGYVGGRVDDLLMGYVNVQRLVPALFVFFFLRALDAGGSMLLVVVAYGLFNWGGVATVVRAETLRLRSVGYVVAAASAGSTDFGVVRRHLVPNVLHTALTAVAIGIPLVIVVEATLSFLKFMENSPYYLSWGDIIGATMSNFLTAWWPSTFALVALLCTTLAFNVVGTTLQDVLDPRIAQ